MSDIIFKVGADTEEAKKQLEQVKRQAEDLKKTQTDKTPEATMKAFTDETARGVQAAEKLSASLGGIPSKLGSVAEAIKALFTGPQGVLTLISAGITGAIAAIRTASAEAKAATVNTASNRTQLIKDAASDGAKQRAFRADYARQQLESGAITRGEYESTLKTLAAEAEKSASAVRLEGLKEFNVRATGDDRFLPSGREREYSNINDALQHAAMIAGKTPAKEGLLSSTFGKLSDKIADTMFGESDFFKTTAEQQKSAMKLYQQLKGVRDFAAGLEDEGRSYERIVSQMALRDAQMRLFPDTAGTDYFVGQQPTDTMRYDAGRRIGGNLANSKVSQNLDTGLNKANNTLSEIKDSINLMRGEMQNLGTF